MTDPVGACPDHGYFGGATCPDCPEGDERGREGGADCRTVLSGERRRRLSKFLSGALRHFPDDAGLTLDEAGWTPFADLVAAADRQYDWATRESVAAVVATDPKGRFERTATGNRGSDRVRAAYGHSVVVDLDAADTDGTDTTAAEATVPDTLYHGTALRNLDAIEREGLRPMERQQVHLSDTVAAAREVGRRHATDPVVLEVDAAGLRAAGHAVAKRGRSVYTTDRVPAAFLSVLRETS